MNCLKLILPIAVVALGLVGAIHTNAMTKKAVALVDKWGYTHLEGSNCVISNTMCRLEGGPFCKQGAIQLYDFVSTSSCPNPLLRIPTP